MQRAWGQVHSHGPGWGDLWQHPGDREAALRGWAQLNWARSVWGALFPDHDGVMSGPQELKG